MARQLVEMDATVHTLVLYSHEELGSDVRRQVRVQPAIAGRVSEMTGGWSDSLNSPSVAVVGKLAEMGEVIAQRYAEMSNQYLVVFEPPASVDATAGFSAGVRRSELRIRVSVDGRPQ